MESSITTTAKINANQSNNDNEFNINDYLTYNEQKDLDLNIYEFIEEEIAKECNKENETIVQTVKNDSDKIQQVQSLPEETTAKSKEKSILVEHEEGIYSFMVNDYVNDSLINRIQGIHFNSWWLRPLVMHKSNQIITLLEGQRILNATQTQLYHSSSISTTMTSRIIKSSSGNLYYLHGQLDEGKMEKNGFDETFIESFRNGFPINWMELFKSFSEDKNSEAQQTQTGSDLSSFNTVLEAAKEKTRKSRKRITEDNSSSTSTSFSECSKSNTSHSSNRSRKKPSNESTLNNTGTERMTRNRRSTVEFKLEWGTGKVLIKD